MCEDKANWGESLGEYQRSWEPPEEIADLVADWQLAGCYEQPVPYGLEVLFFDAGNRPPKNEELKKICKTQQGKRPTPVLVAVRYRASGETRARVYGLERSKVRDLTKCSVGLLEQVVVKALAAQSRMEATRHLRAKLVSLDSNMPGLINAELFATHELENGLPSHRQRWEYATAQAKRIKDLHGQALIEGLGFTVSPIDSNLLLLKVGARQRAIAVLLQDDESYDAPETQLSRFTRSPVSDALIAADNQNVQWVILTRSSEIRLYASKAETGLGGGLRTEKYLELDLDLLSDGHAGYLPLIFSAEALQENGSLAKLVSDSSRFTAELASRLRDRVYNETIPILGKAIADRISREPTEQDLDNAYQQAMLVLFRLLFLAYGEDRGLLPMANEGYRENSLTHIVQRTLMKVVINDADYGPVSTSLWEKFKLLCRAVDKGQPTWGLPAYNGGLFSRDPKVNSNGAVLDAMVDLADKDFGPALEALLIDDSPEGKGPVDFRELSVREFGTIYEGLLESHLAVAKTNLAIKVKNKQDLYVPATQGDKVVVKAGEVYLRNQSGARKASGSYFTKAFAVNHILKHSLSPALDNHLKRVETMMGEVGEVAAARALFDFRCADIAMGSGHFLVAALDMIAERFTVFLNEHDLPPVNSELKRLLIRARQELGGIPEGEDKDSMGTEVFDGEISFEMLLRRQVARHCIYGVDLHNVAVELAKVALWVHTFVPGLPLTLFNHNLRLGDSLTGMCDVQEASKTLGFEEVKGSLFFEQLELIVNKGAEACEKLGNIHVDTVAEIDLAREAWREAEAILKPARQLFDLATAKRAGVDVTLANDAFDEKAIEAAWSGPEVQAAIEEFNPLHFQVAFPEVFIGEREGFDCLVGNPPWEKLMVSNYVWWGLRFPGLRALPDLEMNKKMEQLMIEHPDMQLEFEIEKGRTERYKNVIKAGDFKLGKGHTDLFKVFAWRFYQLAKRLGYIGIVLPRSAVQASGLEIWRKKILEESSFVDVTSLVNKKGWVFDDVASTYSIILCSIQKNKVTNCIGFRGPFNSEIDYQAGLILGQETIPVSELLGSSTMAAFPSLPTNCLGIYRKIKQSDTEILLVDDETTPRPAMDLNQKTDKDLFTPVNAREELWPIYKGASFNLWTPDTGEYVIKTNPQRSLDRLLEKKYVGKKSEYNLSNEALLTEYQTLPCFFPRVAYRNITSPNASRTSIVCLIPPKVISVHSVWYLLFQQKSQRLEGYYLGVMSSIPFDWYCRRVVELNFTADIFKECPFPQPAEDDPLRLRVVELAGRLAAVDERYAEWAEAVGVPVASANNDPVKSDLIAELDAAVALLYGLDKDDLHRIWDTFYLSPPKTDRRSDLKKVLSHHSNLHG